MVWCSLEASLLKVNMLRIGKSNESGNSQNYNVYQEHVEKCEFIRQTEQDWSHNFSK